MVHTDDRPPTHLTRKTKHTLLALAATLFTTGVALPHALLIAAGLILAGSIGLGEKH